MPSHDEFQFRNKESLLHYLSVVDARNSIFELYML